MRQVLCSNEVLLEEARVMKLDYYLTERISESESAFTYYGAMITKHLDDSVESYEIKGISTSRDEVVSIIKKLCQYEVTPISMVEIVDELVSEGT